MAVREKQIVLKNIKNFDLAQTLDCGQAFRWKSTESGSWVGIAHGKRLELIREGEDIIILGTNESEFESVWKKYFDLDRDYGAIIDAISCDETLKAASLFGSGIRILKQDPWEALCSFIISQNNNIPRIKGIVERLCENFGEEKDGYYTFPSYERLACCSVEDLAPLRSGFRAKYIIDAAQKIASGEINLDTLEHIGYIEAQKQLMTIKGVGPKVADCALLYGLGYIEAFPSDVWIKRALNEFFGGKIPECAKPFGGIVQQYIFYYIRETSKT